MAGRDRPHMASLVDEFLKAEKRLVGEPDWGPGNRPSEQRLNVPLSINGAPTNVNLQITAYPNEPTLRFTITLNWPPCFWRVDYDPPHKRHTNPLHRVPLLGGARRVEGPSYHSWADNKHLATMAALPDNLDCARPLASKIRGWDNTFRWFCEETRIVLGGSKIELPPKTRFI